MAASSIQLVVAPATMTDRYVEPPDPPRGSEWRGNPTCSHGETGPHQVVGFPKVYAKGWACDEWEVSPEGSYRLKPAQEEEEVTKDVSDMDTFTYKIKFEPDRNFPWMVEVYGPNGKTLNTENSMSRWGAHYNARRIVRRYRKDMRIQMQQIDKTASPEIVGSFHRKRFYER